MTSRWQLHQTVYINNLLLSNKYANCFHSARYALCVSLIDLSPTVICLNFYIMFTNSGCRSTLMEIGKTGQVDNMIKYAMHDYQKDLIPTQSPLMSLLLLWGRRLSIFDLLIYTYI